MNILLCSVPFRPSVGGIETVSALLADQFLRAGHAVTVLTQTPGSDETAPLAVWREPGARRLIAAVRQADVVLHNGISLRMAWPLLAVRRPWVIAHHMWLPRRGPGAAAAWVKRRVLPMAAQIAVSDAMARDLPLASTVIPNPYDCKTFRFMDGVERSRELVFVGRLVSDKGVPLLLDALSLLQRAGRSPRLSIIGTGPELASLQAQVRRLGLQSQVRFAGALVGEGLARALNAHRVVVVPSMWEEPFGLVALEAVACGCIPVVASSGGLPQAAGPGGVVFRKGDAQSLADSLMQALQRAPLDGSGHDPAVEQHLRRHQPELVAGAYLDVLHHAQRHAGLLARTA